MIANLVEGEILQLNKVVAESEALAGAKMGGGADGWNIYLRKTYLKTASLMAKGARASVVLGVTGSAGVAVCAAPPEPERKAVERAGERPAGLGTEGPCAARGSGRLG